MDQFYLYVICASILLLVTAFALGTPGLKTDVPSETIIIAGRTAMNFVLGEESPDNVISDRPTRSLGRVPGGRTQWE